MGWEGGWGTGVCPNMPIFLNFFKERLTVRSEHEKIKLLHDVLRDLYDCKRWGDWYYV